MTEISLRGEKYTGVFNGCKHEVSGTRMASTEIGKHPESYRHEWYDGAGILQYLSNGKRHFFIFLIREDYCKSSLKETLEELAVNSGGNDSFLESINCRIKEFFKESEKQIPRIALPE